jgi:hypothetical protein
MDHAPRTEADQQAFYEAALAAALAAEAGVGRHVVRLAVAGLRIDLVFAGPRLQPELLPALSHLVTDSPEPATAVFHLWDGKTTGVRMPPPPCPRHEFTDRGDLWGFTSERFRTAFHWIEYAVYTFDRETGVGVYWVQDPDALPYWAKASPLRTLLHWALERDGAQLLHAAAVGTEHGAILITGKGGTGKSSTALAALSRGLQYVGDDYLAVRLTPEPTAHTLYSTAKLNAGDVEVFPSLAPLVHKLPADDGEKAVLHLYPERREQIVPTLRLRAVATPRVTPRTDTGWAPADALQLRRAASFTTLSQLPYAGQRTQAFIDALIDRLPGFELQLGADRDGVVDGLRRLLACSDEELRAQAGRRAAPQAAANPPLVSVVIPVYDGARFLPEAIACVLAQGYPCVEIIVVDDGSTDDVADVVAQLPVDVRFFRQDNAGPAAARNRGIRDASGDYLAFLDVDDLWPPDTLRSLAATLGADPALSVVHGHAQMLMLDPATGAFRPEGNPAESFPYYIGAGLYRREAFATVGLFDVAFRFGEDTDWYTRLRESGLRVERVPQVTLEVRRHGGNMTARKTRAELSATSLGPFRKALLRARAAGVAPGARVVGTTP